MYYLSIVIIAFSNNQKNVIVDQQSKFSVVLFVFVITWSSLLMEIVLLDNHRKFNILTSIYGNVLIILYLII